MSNHLRQECCWLERLEHNTKVHYGFETSEILPQLNPESEAVLTFSNPKALTTEPVSHPPTLPPQSHSSLTSSPSPDSCHILNSHNGNQQTLAGCTWSANSCAYDTFFMLLFALYRDSSQPWRENCIDSGPWFRFLADRFEHVMLPSNLCDPVQFSRCRDDLRSMLSTYDARSFPAPGWEYTSILRIFEVFQSNLCYSQTLSQVLICESSCIKENNALHIPGASEQSGWTNATRTTSFEYYLNYTSIQLFIDLQIAAKIRWALNSLCNQCHSVCKPSVALLDSSPWLFIWIPPNVLPKPEISETLEIRGETEMINYQLFGVVYYNGNHFVGIWVSGNNSCWGYDGLAHGGKPG